MNNRIFMENFKKYFCFYFIHLFKFIKLMSLSSQGAFTLLIIFSKVRLIHELDF